MEKKYHKKYRETHKEEARVNRKKWEEEHPIEVRSLRLVKNYNVTDRKHGRGKGDLTAKWIRDNIFAKPCAHCGKTGWDIIGCNRLDNSKPHTMDNVEPCCKECNDKLWAKDLSKKVYQYSLDNVFIKVFDSMKKASEETGACKSEICKCCKGKADSAGGYKWGYENNELI